VIDLGIDVERLAALVSDALGGRCRLQPMAVRCTYPVFRGEADGKPVFVKIGTQDEWVRTFRLQRDIGDCAVVPRLLVDTPLAYGEHAVFVMEWRESAVVCPEDMTDAQAESFVNGCLVLSQALQKVRTFTPAAGSPLEPERLFGAVGDYVRRHPFAGRLLRRLTELPPERRTYGRRPLFVLHGDFHSKNFGFVGDSLARVIDFDQLTQGLACGDFVNALVERFSCLHLSARARRRLGERTRQMLLRVPWSRDEMDIACNVLRLRFAARRLEKHPQAAWVALDVLRRDRKISEFLRHLP